MNRYRVLAGASGVWTWLLARVVRARAAEC